MKHQTKSQIETGMQPPQRSLPGRGSGDITLLSGKLVMAGAMLVVNNGHHMTPEHSSTELQISAPVRMFDVGLQTVRSRI
jgi:hypothetical protein